MKKLTAIIKPFRLEEVRDELKSIGVYHMTATEAKGFGDQKGLKDLYRGAEYIVDFLPKLKLEVVVTDDLLDKAIEAVARGARTGKIGDGKIFVEDVLMCIAIKTGERLHEASLDAA